MTTTTASRTVRTSEEYARILAKFVEQISERPDWSVTLADLDRGVRDAIAMNDRNRRARLVECPACGIRRRDPRFEHCAVCARLARAEDAWQAKAKPHSPTADEIDRLFAERAAAQRKAAARELHRRYLTNQLPAGCKVVKEEDKEVCIQTPLGLFILLATEAAQVHELSIDKIDEGWDEDTAAA